jgi:hypothetical protein
MSCETWCVMCELSDIEAEALRMDGRVRLGNAQKLIYPACRGVQLNAYLSTSILFASHGRLWEALPYFEWAAELGNPAGAAYAAQARQELGMQPDRLTRKGIWHNVLLRHFDPPDHWQTCRLPWPAPP